MLSLATQLFLATVPTPTISTQLDHPFMQSGNLSATLNSLIPRRPLLVEVATQLAHNSNSRNEGVNANVCR